jgi:23S rRNA (cytidine2498-2'-O)-methyltransferase
MHLWWSIEDSEPFLLHEIHRAFPGRDILRPAPGFIGLDSMDSDPGPMAFAAQTLPQAEAIEAASIRAWADRLTEGILANLSDHDPWHLHLAPCYGQGSAGLNRCGFIRESLVEALKRQRRQRLRSLQVPTDSLQPGAGLVQALLTAPKTGFLSVLSPDSVDACRSSLVPCPSGDIPVASDKSAPSRAFCKLVEAEIRLGRRIGPGETVIDLGACPGSWTYVAANRGARVISVDRSPLRDDLMRHPRITFHQGDAFQFVPVNPVDWLICDVIAAPDRSIGLVMEWVRRRWARQFVVTIKFKGSADYEKLDGLKRDLAPLCREFRLARLCANRNEACVMGMIR